MIREEDDGSITVIASSFQGRRLNRPSDVVGKSDGAIYFSDPNTGNAVPDYFELQKTPQEEEQQCRRSTTEQGTDRIVGRTCDLISRPIGMSNAGTAAVHFSRPKFANRLERRTPHQ